MIQILSESNHIEFILVNFATELIHIQSKDNFMPVDLHAFKDLHQYCNAHGVQLVAVSKTKPNEDILALYENGHRVFGENYVQELVKKQEELPKDILWHFIGHLQSNKVKYIAPFVSLIHGVDSIKLLQAIEKEAGKNNRMIPCLLQMHIASEETKFGFDIDELRAAAAEIFLEKKFPHVQIAGLMGMASFSENQDLIQSEFQQLKSTFDEIKSTYPEESASFKVLSMGMSGDYQTAVACGSNMIRVGSVIFGARSYPVNS
jgi:pyridoxal phosphate enzyme (YggS family)